MSVIIKEEDLIQSIADGIQFISYYHPVDYIRHLARAYEREESPAARDAMAQILTNSRMCAEGKRPLCQDTGIVNVFLKIGMSVRFDTKRTLQELCDEGVRRGYLNPDNPLRASVLDDPLFARKNTRDNTPCILHVELVQGDKVDVQIASKGGVPRTRPSSRCSIPAIRWWIGCSRPFRRWAPAGARPACWASALAAPLKRRC